jgi:TolA-binding protein
MKAKHFLLASALLLWTGVLEAQTYQVPVSEKNEKMQEEIIQFFAAVTMDLRRTNEIQRQKINQQEKRIRQLEKRANEFVMFRDKAKHPFRTIWKKLFR